MLNANNKVNYETSIKQKEKKYSLSTVLAWLYLKTIGRILPERWNKWAENILHHNQVIVVNGVQTDNLFNSDREKELKDEIEKLKEKLKEDSKKEENQSNLNQELTKKEKEITELKEQVKLLEEEKEGKEGKISSLTELNKVLEQKKKEMETKSNAQQQIIFDQEKKIKEQGTLINSLTSENKDINETVKKDNESLRAQNTELKSKFSKLNNESDTKIKQLENQLEEKQAELEQAKKKNTELDVLKKQLEKEKIDWEDKLNVSEKNKKDLEREINELKEKAQEKDAEVENLKQQLEKDKSDLEGELRIVEGEKKKLENQLEQQQEKLKQAEKKGAEVENLKQQLEQKITDLTNQLKDSISKLNAAEKNKKDLEGEVKELKEKVQILEKNRAEIEKQKADLEKKLEFSQGENKKLQEQVEHLSQEREKATSIAISSVENNVETLSETLKNQQIESSKPEDVNKETKALDAKSMLSTTKSITKSTFSKVKNKLLGNEDLNNFLSDQNEELKRSFPEFKGEHFCHNVLKKTIQSLSNQSDGKFESNKLLALLKENLVKSGKAIIETKVNKVVEELAKDHVKKHDLKQVIFVEKCAKELYLNEEDSKAIISSFTEFLAQKNVSNNDSVKKFVVQKLTEAEMKCFSDNIQQLASSIRDKFLSPDQRMCNKTQGRVNEYQLTDKAKKEYELTPNSSISYTTSSNIQGLAR